MTLRRAPFLPSVALEELGCAALFAFFAMQGFIPGIAPSVALEMTGSAPTGLTTIGGILSQAAADVFILLLLLRRPRLLLGSKAPPDQSGGPFPPGGGGARSGFTLPEILPPSAPFAF